MVVVMAMVVAKVMVMVKTMLLLLLLWYVDIMHLHQQNLIFPRRQE